MFLYTDKKEILTKLHIKRKKAILMQVIQNQLFVENKHISQLHVL